MSKENEKLTEAAEQNIEASKKMELSEEQLNHVVGGSGTVDRRDGKYWCHKLDVSSEQFHIYYYSSANGCRHFNARYENEPCACTNCEHFIKIS